MHEDDREWRAAPGARLERAIILQLLSGERERRSSSAELAAELGADAAAFQDALGRLSETGVVCLAGPDVWASPAAWRLDELGLIAV